MQPKIRASRIAFRVAAAGTGALAVVLALNFGDPGWFEKLAAWARPAPRVTAARPPASPGPIGAPVTVTPPRPVGNDSSVSLVPLPLILVRTQLGRNSREGFAQIGVNARSPQTYAAGSVLANGARLVEVYERYVVLERDGRSARLYRQGEVQPPNPRDTALVTVGGTPPEPAAQLTSRDELSQFIRPSPVFVGTQLRGYALYAGRQPAAFSDLGLEPGDVLTSINGTLVSGANDSLGSLNTLTEGAVLNVVIERQGVAQSLSLDGSVLAQERPQRKYLVEASRNPLTNL